MKLCQRVEIALPGWVEDFVGDALGGSSIAMRTHEERMALAVALSRENVRRQTGGPFGAIVVNEDSGELLGVGVNLVTHLQLSTAHAEMVAFALAQQAVSSWNLGSAGPIQLVTSCEPCAMCFGAVPWSGVGSLICGARKMHAEAAGFDEGDKPADWVESLRRRGIRVELDVLRDEASSVLHDYAASDGTIYHPGRTPGSV